MVNSDVIFILKCILILKSYSVLMGSIYMLYDIYVLRKTIKFIRKYIYILLTLKKICWRLQMDFCAKQTNVNVFNVTKIHDPQKTEI